MPFARFEWMIALRYLRARRSEGFVSVIAGFSFLGIVLGVATLIIVMSVMNGFRDELLKRILGLNGDLTIEAGERGIPDYPPIVARVRGVKGVVRVTPLVEGQVMATANRAATGALVRGVTPADLKAETLVAHKIVAGSLKDFSGSDAVAIGDRLASRLGLHVGDRITLISPQGTATAIGMVPRIRSYRIVALFDVGMYEYDSTFVFMPLAEAQTYFQMAGRATGIQVSLDNPDVAPAASAAIARLLGGDYRIYNWQQANAPFFNAVEVERNVMFLILTLIIIVAAFNIISGLTMLVKDKSRDIAILRTMGTSRGSVMRVFFIAGATIGVLGTVVGFVLGILFCANIETIREWLQSLTGTNLFNPEIYFLSTLPAKVDPTEVVAVVGMAILLSLLATLYPAWRAARLDPVEALRYE